MIKRNFTHELHHNTVLDVAIIAQQLDVKNLVLYHTEDSMLSERKEHYIAEAHQSIFRKYICPMTWKYHYMWLDENLLQQRFFRLLSEYSQRKVSASEFTEAIEELATHVADFGINEQDYSILLRYFSFGLHRLKSYRVRFEQEKNALFAFN